jgi:uncharacterized protein YndB with AHSA1/START domain
VQYSTSVRIDAPAETVWAVLTDVVQWPEWNSTVTRAEMGGVLSVGNRVRMKQKRMPRLTWLVTEVAPGDSFSWTTRSPGVTTVAEHKVKAESDGTTVTEAILRQTGPLSGVVGVLFGERTRRYMDVEAAGLKRRCEEGEDARPERD